MKNYIKIKYNNRSKKKLERNILIFQFILH